MQITKTSAIILILNLALQGSYSFGSVYSDLLTSNKTRLEHLENIKKIQENKLRLLQNELRTLNSEKAIQRVLLGGTLVATSLVGSMVVTSAAMPVAAVSLASAGAQKTMEGAVAHLALDTGRLFASHFIVGGIGLGTGLTMGATSIGVSNSLLSKTNRADLGDLLLADFKVRAQDESACKQDIIQKPTQLIPLNNTITKAREGFKKAHQELETRFQAQVQKLPKSYRWWSYGGDASSDFYLKVQEAKAELELIESEIAVEKALKETLSHAFARN